MSRYDKAIAEGICKLVELLDPNASSRPEPTPIIVQGASGFLACLDTGETVYVVPVDDGTQITYTLFKQDGSSETVSDITWSICEDVRFDVEGTWVQAEDCKTYYVEIVNTRTSTNLTRFVIYYEGGPEGPATNNVGQTVPLEIGFETCKECNGQVFSANGTTYENLVAFNYNQLTIMVPKCCAISITNAFGTLEIPAQPQGYVFEKTYTCTLSSLQLSADCLDKVHVIQHFNP